MSERPKLLRRRPRRRPLQFWISTWLAAMWAFCKAGGVFLFQVFWWVQYGVWLPEPTSSYFDGRSFYHPDTPWVVSYPVLRFIFPIPLTVTITLLEVLIVGSMMLLDDWRGSGRKTRKIRFKSIENVEHR